MSEKKIEPRKIRLTPKQVEMRDKKVAEFAAKGISEIELRRYWNELIEALGEPYV